jgi:hypothetical protein
MWLFSCMYMWQLGWMWLFSCVYMWQLGWMWLFSCVYQQQQCSRSCTGLLTAGGASGPPHWCASSAVSGRPPLDTISKATALAAVVPGMAAAAARHPRWCASSALSDRPVLWILDGDCINTSLLNNPGCSRIRFGSSSCSSVAMHCWKSWHTLLLCF